MTIRPAAAGDAGAIAAIWNAAIRDTAVTFTTAEKTADDVAALIASRPAFLVAQWDGAVAGFATFGAFRGGPGYAHSAELTILCAPAACGLGLGPGLLSALEDVARATDIHVLVAGVSGENPGAVRFFEREGYGPPLRMPQTGRKFGRWIDLVLLQKIL